VIVVRDLGFQYPGAENMAIQGLELTVEQGQVLAVAGANGSGKSTLALLLNGLLAPTTGSVTIDEMSTTDADFAWKVRSTVGVVFQNPENQIVGTVVEEDVAFGPENLGVDRAEIRSRVDGALLAVGLEHLKRSEPHLLSGGQKQRLAIAGALALQPDYLVFDEPTSMLDPVKRQNVLAIIETLRSEGRGIVHITHHLQDVVTADAVLILREGQVAYRGTPEGLFSSSDSLGNLGLALPPVATLGNRLRDAGIPLPSTCMTAESIVSFL